MSCAVLTGATQDCTSGATNVLPAPFREPLLRLTDAAPALATAKAPSSVAAARTKAIRTSLPFLGILIFLLLRVRGQGTAGRVGGGIRRRSEVETKWLRGLARGAAGQLVRWLRCRSTRRWSR